MLQNVKTVTVDRQFLQVLMNEKELSKKDFRVVLALMSILDSVNYKKVSKKKIAESTGLDKDDISDSIEKLKESGLLIEGNDGHIEGYKFFVR